MAFEDGSTKDDAKLREGMQADGSYEEAGFHERIGEDAHTPDSDLDGAAHSDTGSSILDRDEF